MPTVKRFILMLLILSGGVGCSQAETTAPSTQVSETTAGVSLLTVDEFAAILDGRSDQFTVVNVHIPYEGEVPNTDLEIAYNEVETLTASLPDRDASIILYCRSGNMSADAAQALVDAGYTQIYDVQGGMNAWTSSGRKLLNAP
jgi:rhodanese-related sulfurtransferase